MRHVVVCGLCPVVQYFSTLSRKRRDFRKKKVTEQLLKEAFLILGGIQQDTVR